MQIYSPLLGASRIMVGIKPENRPLRFTLRMFLHVWRIVSFAALLYSMRVFTMVIGSMIVEQMDRATNPEPREYSDLWLMFLPVNTLALNYGRPFVSSFKKRWSR